MTIVIWINHMNQTHLRSYDDADKAREVYEAVKATGAAVSWWYWPEELAQELVEVA